MLCFNSSYEYPDKLSLRIETCCQIMFFLLHWVVFKRRAYTFLIIISALYNREKFENAFSPILSIARDPP
jgi:hypothetical protein